jgi:hypothetical protein
VAVGDQRRAGKAAAAAETHAGSDGVADYPDRAGEAEREQVLERQGIHDPLDREDAGRDRAEDRQHDRDAGAALGSI